MFIFNSMLYDDKQNYSMLNTNNMVMCVMDQKYSIFVSKTTNDGGQTVICIVGIMGKNNILMPATLADKSILRQKPTT